MISSGSTSDDPDNMRRISDFDVACLRAGVTGQPVGRQVLIQFLLRKLVNVVT